MEHPPRIFNLMGRPAPVPKPMSALLEHVRRLEPPGKSEALLAAESALACAKQERAELHGVMMAKANTFRTTEYAGLRSPVRFEEIRGLERRLDELSVEVAKSRAAVRDLSEPWRREYAQLILRETMPVRTGISEFLDELGAALEVLGEINARAEQANVGSPWISRLSGHNALQMLRQVQRILLIDSQLLR